MAARFPLLAALIAAVIAPATSAAGCGHEPTRQPRAPGPQPALRMMTYNVNFGIPGDEPTLAAIELGRADIVFLQEINTAWEQALRARFARTYPHLAFYPRGGAGGIAVLSRWPLGEQRLVSPAGEGWFPALRLVIASPLGSVQALVVHLRPPVSDGGSFISGHFSAPRIHKQEIERFCQTLDGRLPTVVVGDFNEEDDGSAIVYLIGPSHRMTNGLPQFAPTRPTWHWTTSVGTLERQLDHIVYDLRLEPLSVEVLDAGNSDHFPVVGVFVLARRE
jgi:endonuclease/exonuclease/phosphatase (EEP) superfamily protein YafD